MALCPFTTPPRMILRWPMAIAWRIPAASADGPGVRLRGLPRPLPGPL